MGATSVLVVVSICVAAVLVCSVGCEVRLGSPPVADVRGSTNLVNNIEDADLASELNIEQNLVRLPMLREGFSNVLVYAGGGISDVAPDSGTEL